MLNASFSVATAIFFDFEPVWAAALQRSLSYIPITTDSDRYQQNSWNPATVQPIWVQLESEYHWKCGLRGIPLKLRISNQTMARHQTNLERDWSLPSYHPTRTPAHQNLVVVHWRLSIYRRTVTEVTSLVLKRNFLLRGGALWSLCTRANHITELKIILRFTAISITRRQSARLQQMFSRREVQHLRLGKRFKEYQQYFSRGNSLMWTT